MSPLTQVAPAYDKLESPESSVVRPEHRAITSRYDVPEIGGYPRCVAADRANTKLRSRFFKALGLPGSDSAARMGVALSRALAGRRVLTRADRVIAALGGAMERDDAFRRATAKVVEGRSTLIDEPEEVVEGRFSWGQ